MEEDAKKIVDRILSQNDKIIDAVMKVTEEKSFEVLIALLDNNGLILDALFPRIQFLASSMEDEPPMMQ